MAFGKPDPEATFRELYEDHVDDEKYQQSWENFYEIVKQMVMAVIRYEIQRYPHLEEEILHDTLIKLDETIKSGKFEYKNAHAFKKYVAKMARNEARHTRRAVDKVNKPLTTLYENTTFPIEYQPTTPIERLENISELKDLSQSLPGRLYRVFILTSKGYSKEEIAEIMGITIHTVENYQHQVNKAIENLKHEQHETPKE